MEMKLLEPAEPNLDPRTKEDELQNVILYQAELMRYEIKRGNDLCQIIFIIAQQGFDGLNQAQKERVDRIITNVQNEKNEKKWMTRNV